MASALTPALKFYQFILFPVAKPCAVLLDGWLGKEGIDYLREKELKNVIRAHIEAEEAEVDHLEGVGAMNFLNIDDVKVSQEGEPLDPASIIQLPTKVDLPIVPDIKRDVSDTFLQAINASGRRWVVLTDQEGEPHLILDADGALRAALFETDKPYDLYDYCRRPLIVRNPEMTIGDVILRLKAARSRAQADDTPIDYDAVLVWSEHPRIITGADVLGRLLKGISAEQAVVQTV